MSLPVFGLETPAVTLLFVHCLLQLAQQQAEAAAALEAKKQEVAASADKLRAIPHQLDGLAAAGHSWNMQPVEPVM